MKKIFVTLVSMMAFLWAGAYSQHIVDSLEKELAKAATLDDSLRLSFDLFDASPRHLQTRRGRDVLALAQRKGDVDAQLDMIRNIANMSTRNDSVFDECLEMLNNLPESRKRDLSKLFVRIKQNTRAARYSNIEESRQKINELMNKVETSQGQSISTKLEVLFTLCAYLEQMLSPELMSDYLEQIGELLDIMTEKGEWLENLYLTQSSMTYTSFGMNEKAVEADKKLLEQISYLEENYRAKGRMFRDFVYSRYVVYRRLLSNYPALTSQEIEDYYNAAKELAYKDPSARLDFEQTRRPDIYYFMARKEYAKALPLIEKEIYESRGSMLPYVKRLLLNMSIEAADSTNNKESLLRALKTLRELDDSEQTRHSAEQFHKLQLIYDHGNEKLEQAQLEIEKRDVEIAGHRRILIVGSVSLMLLIVLLVILVRMWRRGRKLNETLVQTNAKLTEERDTLQRTQADLIRTGERARAAEKQREDFINNMSHEVSTPLNAVVEYSQLIVDCVDTEKNPYLIKFADIVKLNADLVLTLVNDVLDLASLENETMKVEKKPESVGRMAEIVIDTVRNRVHEGVQLINDIDVNDRFVINTDIKRASQVLLNLLANAAKFTNEGSIRLSGRPVNDEKFYEFAVTDTGIGIPEGKEDVIFERFEKLNRFSQGIGLGLPVCRLIATLLGGEVVVDTTYTDGGSRFLFTIPVK